LSVCCFSVVNSLDSPSEKSILIADQSFPIRASSKVSGPFCEDSSVGSIDRGRLSSWDQSALPRPTLPTTHTSSDWLIISTSHEPPGLSAALIVRVSPGNVGCLNEYSAQPPPASPRPMPLVSCPWPIPKLLLHPRGGPPVCFRNFRRVYRVGYIGAVFIPKIGNNGVLYSCSWYRLTFALFTDSGVRTVLYKHPAGGGSINPNSSEMRGRGMPALAWPYFLAAPPNALSKSSRFILAAWAIWVMNWRSAQSSASNRIMYSRATA